MHANYAIQQNILFVMHAHPWFMYDFQVKDFVFEHQKFSWTNYKKSFYVLDMKSTFRETLSHAPYYITWDLFNKKLTCSSLQTVESQNVCQGTKYYVAVAMYKLSKYNRQFAFAWLGIKNSVWKYTIVYGFKYSFIWHWNILFVIVASKVELLLIRFIRRKQIIKKCLVKNKEHDAFYA